ncbi:CHAP domain-containing protein [Plantibacter sp. CFBP 13570]|uniref:CHAP domain-containing protein n=1 Tax=Plantibacter sp. CFBP 13570 TaxID=2775272 RepID=UPI001930BDEF|nr:CHAP domain-containing protein [Plantibacter sp. CFBP 13570]MBD8535651.1 CHAP domain-containing protein [Plantibacter sp. CFBP 13570]
MKTVAAAVTVLLLVGAFFGLMLSGGGSNCAAALVGTADAANAPADGVAGFTGDQLVNAATIINTAASMGLSGQAQIIGVMTSIGESSLVNIGYGDEDQGVTNPDGSPTCSVGLFQQQWCLGWGTREQVLDPVYASTQFFTRLAGVAGWESLEPTIAAHRVQGNADPDHYTRFLEPAQQIVTALTGNDASQGGCTDDPSTAAGDDYPWPNEAPDTEGGGLSPLRYYYRECVDFVAWRLNRDAGVTAAPWKWDWSTLTPMGGNAIDWPDSWAKNGWATSLTPRAGSVAWWGTSAGSYGHVAYVQAVNPDGTVVLEEYNWGRPKHMYGTRTVPATSVDLFLYAPGGAE